MSGHIPGPWKLILHGNETYPFPLSVHTEDDGYWIARGGEVSSLENAKLIAAAPALLEKSIALREAQRAYMADRGNDLLGMKVAEAAQELDLVIALAEQEGK